VSTAPTTEPRHSAWDLWAIALVVALALGFAAGLRDEPPPEPVPRSAPELAARAPVPTSAERAPATITVAGDGLPLMPHDPRDPVAPGPVHPHPITSAHSRIYRENNLLGLLNGAMDVKDAAGMRRLLERYREDYPEDANELQEGYALIADCLEHPDEATIGRARRYHAEETASSLRRYVRRHCFERR